MHIQLWFKRHLYSPLRFQGDPKAPKGEHIAVTPIELIVQVHMCIGRGSWDTSARGLEWEFFSKITKPTGLMFQAFNTHNYFLTVEGSPWALSKPHHSCMPARQFPEPTCLLRHLCSARLVSLGCPVTSVFIPETQAQVKSTPETRKPRSSKQSLITFLHWAQRKTFLVIPTPISESKESTIYCFQKCTCLIHI